MGAGKTTAGKKLARKLDFEFFDLDQMIENTYRITIPDIFNKFDETAFRKLEHETLKSTIGLNRSIIATGGGTPCFFDNMDQMNRNGLTVYLKLSVKSLTDRLINSHKARPLVKEKDDREDFITQKLNEREVFYNQANIIIKGENLDLEYLEQKITEIMQL